MTDTSLFQRIRETPPRDRDALSRLEEAVGVSRDAQSPGSRAREQHDTALALLRALVRAPWGATRSDLEKVAKLCEASTLAAGGESGSEGPIADTELRLACDMTLGDVLIREGYIGAGCVEQALRTQFRTGQRLGAILVEQGSITPFQLDEGLRLQFNMRRDADRDHDRGTSKELEYPKKVADCLLGELLRRRGSISEADLERALVAQRATGMRIGEALVDVGATTWNEIEHALALQSVLRRGG